MQSVRLIGLLAAFTLLSTTACTTTRSFAGTGTAELVHSLSRGDKVRIIEVDGSEYDLTIEAVKEDALVGERAYLGTVEVALTRIHAAELTKLAPARTAGAVVGGTVLFAVVGAVVVAAAMGGAFAPDY
jgi:hypothetical protein